MSEVLTGKMIAKAHKQLYIRQA